MASQVHYEIFRRKSTRSGWILADVCAGRDDAIELAREMMTSKRLAGVKVVKETFSEETGGYLSLKIFEQGQARRPAPPPKTDTPVLPCFRPADLYSARARNVMARLLADFLAHNGITVMELIHRADMLKALEAAGTLYQHAIQKVAVAQAAATGQPVQQIVRTLGELATRAMQKVYRDAHDGAFPELAPQAIGALAAKLCRAEDGAYRLNGAIARHLTGGRNWDDKLLRLVTLMCHAPTELSARCLLLTAVDAIVAEMMGGPALHALVESGGNPAQTLAGLIALFLGVSRRGTGGNGLAALAAAFAAGELPGARSAAARRIVEEFRGNRRLAPNALEELRMMRRLADRAMTGVGRHLDHDDLTEALALRSQRLVTQEVLAAHLLDAAPDEKVSRLLFVEENVIGAENRRRIAAFVLPIVAAPAFERIFRDETQPLFRRLRRLAELQGRVLRSGFVDAHRQEIAGQMDRIALDLAEGARLFQGMESRPAAKRIAMLMKLIDSGVLTEGLLAARARAIALATLATPGFFTSYLAGRTAEGESAETAVATLTASLGRIGITAETGLKTIAA